MKLLIIITVTAILLMLPIIVFAADGTITGSITDYESGDPLWDVLIKVPTAHVITNSDFQGNYQFTLPEGKHVITFSVMGYSTLIKHITITADKTVLLNARMSVSELATGLTVQSTTTAREVTVSQTTIEKKRIDHTSRAGFTSDITTTLKKLPGVASDGTFSGELYIRGGMPQENLFILDRVILTSPYKWDGMMTLINPDVVKKVNFYTGGFPAEYGQAMSGLIHCETLDPPKDRKTHGRLKMDPANFNYYQYGPLAGPGNNSGYVVSSRVTYYDLVAGLFLKLMEDEDLYSSGTRLPWFYDAFGKVYLDVHRKHKLFFSSLWFNNGTKLKFTENEVEENTNSNDTYTSTYSINELFKFSDTTTYISGTWKYIPGDKLTVYTTTSWVRQSGYNISIDDYTDDWFENISAFGITNILHGYIRSYEYTTNELKRDEYQFYANAHYAPAAWYTINIGTTIIPYTMTSRDISGSFNDEYEHYQLGTNSDSVHDKTTKYSSFKDKFNSVYGAAFVENEISIIPQHWVFHLGIRETYYERTHQALTDPRLMTKITLFDNWAVKLAAGQFSQYSFEETSDSKYGNTKLKAEESHHYIGGIEKIIVPLDLKIRSEVFYKTYNNLIVEVEQKEGNYQNWAIGETKGYELFLEKSLSEHFEGWVAYTYTDAWRKITSKARNSSLDTVDFFENTSRVNVKYAPNNLQKHILSVNVDCYLTDWLMVTADFRYHTGAPYTKVVGRKYKYYSVTNFIYNGTLIITNISTESNPMPNFSGNFHDGAMRDYHRLNLGLNINTTLLKEKHREKYTNSIGTTELALYNMRVSNILKQLSETTNKKQRSKLHKTLIKYIQEYDTVQNKLWKFSENPQLHNRLLMRAEYAENKEKAARLFKRYDQKLQPKPHLRKSTLFIDVMNAYKNKSLEIGKWYDAHSGQYRSQNDLPFMVLAGFMIKY